MRAMPSRHGMTWAEDGEVKVAAKDTSNAIVLNRTVLRAGSLALTLGVHVSARAPGPLRVGALNSSALAG